MASRIVIALGGNALGNNPIEQKRRIEEVSESLVGLIASGYEIIVTHGNGPQVGMIDRAFEISSKGDTSIPQMPLPESVAMSQGYIGYHLQNGILRELRRRHMPWHVSTMVTQTVVDKNDKAFKNPTKPIGRFYTKEEAEALKRKNPDVIYSEDAGRGYRQMVASPSPVDIVETESILNLLDNEFVVIACGGGGIPVIKIGDGNYEGVDAVVDKDFAAALLADKIDAEYLFILTAVDRVAINYGKEDEQFLDHMSVDMAKKYAGEGHFAAGSMLPKVEAAISFASKKAGRRAVIASLERASQAIMGHSGTVIELENSDNRVLEGSLK